MAPESFVKFIAFAMPLVFLLLTGIAADCNHLPFTICFSAAMISAAIIYVSLRGISL